MSGTTTGESPGWVAGYVPPASEWNSWFARKMDIDNAEFIGGPFLPVSGGTLSGPLYLPAAMPVNPEEAASKQYVDSLTFAAGPFMPMTGGTFSGPVTYASTLTLMGNPSGLLDATPKQYVDAVGQTASSGLTVANAAVRRAGDTMTGLLVLAADPVNPLGAVTKQYSDTKLPLAGGTITGNLTVNGTVGAGNGLYSNTTFFANSFNGYEWSFAVDGNGSKFQTYRTGWYDTWNGTNGTRTWVGPSGGLMSLDGGGNFNVVSGLTANAISGNSVTSNGNASIAGTVFTAALNMGPWLFYNNGDQIQQHTAGWYDQWRTSDGTRMWVGGNVIQMTLDPGGNFAARATITANQLVSNQSVLAAAGLFAATQNMFMGNGGSGRILQMNPSWYWDWNITTGSLAWMANTGGFFHLRTTDWFAANYLGPFAGTGAYVNLSDERAKTDIEPASCGLAEVLALKPIEFARVGKDARRDIGFSAQQLRGVMPLAVRPFGVVMPDGSGALDSDEPSLGMALEPIVAALVNGMKELNARLAAMEGGAFFP